jgi:ribosomal subunit interface protein
MQILTTGKNLDIGEALRKRIEDRLTGNLAKYFDGTVRAHVVVELQKSKFKTECTLHLSTGLTLQSRGEGTRPMQASTWRPNAWKSSSGAISAACGTIIRSDAKPRTRPQWGPNRRFVLDDEAHENGTRPIWRRQSSQSRARRFPT